jgi:opacity protein-like surface antigen
MKKSSLIILSSSMLIASTLSHANGKDKFNNDVALNPNFWFGIQSSYAYDEALRVKNTTTRDAVDANSWTNLTLFGWTALPIFQPYVGAGAYKLRIVDNVPPSENTVGSDLSQGNVITKPSFAWKVGVKGQTVVEQIKRLIFGYDVSYMASKPNISYAVIRGSIGTNQPIDLKYHSFLADVIVGLSNQDGSIYAGPSYRQAKGKYTKPFINLSNNNTYNLSNFEQQESLGLIAGINLKPNQSWAVDLKTRFINTYDVSLTVTHVA